MATQEIINVGTLPNDGEGDPLRVAFQKINNNFTQLFSTDFSTTEANTQGTTPQVIFETSANTFTQATIQVNSSEANGSNSQNITINAALSNDKTNIKWTGHSILINGSSITSYNMDVSGANVRLLALPIISGNVVHFISSQVTHLETQ